MTEAIAGSRASSGVHESTPRPIMRSVVHRKHAELGAQFEMRGSWSVPAVYASIDAEIAALRTTVGFADISARGTLHLSGAVDGYVSSLTGAKLDPLYAAAATSGGVVARLAGDWALALLAPSAEGAVMASLEQQQADGAMATDVTSAYSGFVVAGPRLDELLVRTLTVDPAGLLPGRCATASWARIPAILVIKESTVPAVEIYVSSDYGRYAWERLQEFAGAPVGWRALEAWGWT